MDALRDMIPFEQFNKREKHPWKSVTIGKEEASSISVSDDVYIAQMLLNRTKHLIWRMEGPFLIKKKLFPQFLNAKN